MSALTDIERQARSLPSAERARLAELMLESLESPLSEIEAAWQHEITERVAAYERGETPTYPAEDVFAEARHLAG